MRQYSPQVWEHFRHPRNAGIPVGSTECVGRGCAAEAGVEVEFVAVMGQGDILTAVGWECLGCPQSIASCSWASERARQSGGVNLPSALDMQRALGLTSDALSRALVVEDALHAAVADARKRRDEVT